jgi:S-adenosylmethionine-diacylgycerolhomoserine-N-methlytransferase
MNPTMAHLKPADSREALQRYYQVQARIYDATRWTFLFGRDKLIRLAAAQVSPERVLEIGCGTGHNLVQLRRCFAAAQLGGWDLSEAMLRRARRRLTKPGCEVDLTQAAYPADVPPADRPDLMVFSYSLSMFNPGWELAIEAAARDLVPGGWLAVVDFHATRHAWFRSWMRRNHVRMEGHLLPKLQRCFETHRAEIRPAWGGLWHYFLFLGTRPAD